MRKAILSCVVLCGLSGACAALSVGCSSDDPGTDSDTPDASTKDSGKDSSPGDSGGKSDTGSTPTDAGQDAPATVDAGQDATADGGADTGTDTGAQDSGTDAAKDATVTDSGAQDAGTDAGDTDSGALDAGTDANTADTGTDAGNTDAGNPLSFDNPLQIDVGTALINNTVVTTTPLNGFALSWMDRTHYDFMTVSRAQQLNASGKGLPDDATFGASPLVHPTVKLHWSNANNQNNSRVVSDATPFSFPIPSAVYSQIQLYGLSTEGQTTVTVLVTYADNSTNGGTTVTIADWFADPLTGQFALIDGLDRIKDGTTFEDAKNPAIFGVNVNPDTSKAVKQITITNTGTGFYVFFGATAW